MFHINIFGSQGVLVNKVSISAPANSPNTDGIHIGYSDNIRITDSGIATGDDCVSMVDGCTNINITGVSCGPGHGISIGSLGKYSRDKDVSGITVMNSSFTNTDNGLRIKTLAPSSPSIASNITFAHIFINNARNPIIVDQHYCPNSSCPNQGESSVQIKGVKFIDIRGSSASPVAVNVQCSKSKPCQDIVFSGLNITYNGKPTTASCSNCDDQFQGDLQVPSNCSST
ncbi:hypothetical protein BUALT_Bualt03G0229800 [Buddleja alternifolia]|uniref:Polygalacturonase n=1 Tax=Buddleja alternifolia TaxID=168488 RepID=A0AAV6Y4L7_9LAMI|nr:hypothetical protein BUALT_Bualt03G0229800 [Buddleja alternifolia]